MILSNNLENKTFSDMYWRVRLVYMEVQPHSSLEPLQEYNQNQTPLMNQGLLWLFWTILAVIEILCSFGLVMKGKTGKEIPKSSRLAFLEKFLANSFALSEAEDKTSGPLNREDVADLPLLRKLLAIRQKSRKPSFWEMMDSFVLVAYASLAASRTLLQPLLVCLNFTLDSEDLFCWYKEKNNFYELWQQHKLLKTMGMSEA